MSDFTQPRDLPTSSSEYSSWRNGWVFGLPTGGELSSEECGAMPFRYQSKFQNTVNAQKCLRGEDWAFLNTVTIQTKNLASTVLWPYYNPQIPQLNAGPYRIEVERMYNFLSATEAAKCFGTGIKLAKNTGQVVDDMSDSVHNALSSQLSGLMQIESQPPAALQPLSLEQMKTFFRDTQKMQCTIADAGYRFTGSRSVLYDYTSYPTSWGIPEEKETSDISSCHATQSYGPSTQMVRAQAQILIGVYGDLYQGGQHTEKYALLNVADPFEMRTSETKHYQLSANIRITGQHIAEVFGKQTGIDIVPQPTGNYESRFQLSVRAQYLALWPQWLINYTWNEDP